MKDLFGNEITVQEALEIERHGKKKRNETPRGYAMPPGTGPAGQTCGTCYYAYANHMAKNYWKCGLVQATGGPKTDIRLKSPACEKWKEKTCDDCKQPLKPARAQAVYDQVENKVVTNLCADCVKKREKPASVTTQSR